MKFGLHPSLYLLLSWAWWDRPLTWLTNHRPSLLWHCWLGYVTHKIVSEMTYIVSTGTLNSTISYHTQGTGNSRCFSFHTVIQKIISRCCELVKLCHIKRSSLVFWRHSVHSSYINITQCIHPSYISFVMLFITITSISLYRKTSDSSRVPIQARPRIQAGGSSELYQ